MSEPSRSGSFPRASWPTATARRSSSTGENPPEEGPLRASALELSAFSSSSLALSEGEIRMTAYVIAIERARIAAM